MPIVFIHGLLGSMRNFEYIQPLFDNSYSFDLIGWGGSNKPNIDYTINLYVEDIYKHVTKKSIIVAHSAGGILAKYFALKYPELVEHVYLINYPLQKDPEKIKQHLNKHWLNRWYLTNHPITNVLCLFDPVYRIILWPFILIKYYKYRHSIWDYFNHTAHSVTSTIQNVIYKDKYQDLYKIKNKVTLIMGENDKYADKDLLKDFETYYIPHMPHLLFGYEDKVADLLKELIKR